jgi:hypothetical protein
VKSITARIYDPQRRARLSLYLVVYLCFLSTPSPVWALAARADVTVEKPLEAGVFKVESIDDLDELRSRLSHRAVKMIGLEHKETRRYGGLSRIQANSVLAIAEAFGPEVFDEAVRVAWCESRLNPNAMTGSNRNGTADRGLFQLNDGGTMQRLGVDPREAFDAYSNAQAAAVLHDDRGWQPWVCAHHLGIKH